MNFKSKILAAQWALTIILGSGQTIYSESQMPDPYRAVEFPSEGAILRGRLYLPKTNHTKPPVVVMAHGYSATIEGMVADRFAERIAAAGFAVLLYDHRNLGISGGEPRQQINVWTQARGYLDAIDYVSTLDEIDPERIAVWGDSMSGGEVIVVGAVDTRVKAIVAQVPGCGAVPAPEDPDGSLFAKMRDTLFHGDIRATPENTRGPIPVVSHSPKLSPAMMQPITAFRWFIEYGGRYGTGWENWVTHVEPEVPVGFNPGLAAPHLSAALLMIVAFDDEMPYVDSEVARGVFRKAPEPKQLVEIDGGHFGLLYYPGELFEKASRAQVQFLEEVFRPIERASMN